MAHHCRRRTVSLLFAAAVVALGGCSTNQPATRPDATKGTATTAVVKDASGKSMAQLFQGKFAGVDVYEAPGGGIRVKIRDSGRLRGEGGEPLYVVDGLEVAAPDGVLFIDPNNIAKIEVEKVSALYGIRGANGVIKITTKR